MQHVEQTPAYLTAKGGCYQCTNPNDGVIFDSDIEGEGILFLCTGCLKEAARLATLGRNRMRAKDKRAEA